MEEEIIEVKAKKKKKISDIISTVVVAVVAAFSVMFLATAIATKASGGETMNFFGNEVRLVLTNSMEKPEDGFDYKDYKIKEIRVNDAVFINRVPEDDSKALEWYSKLNVGDVLTFKYRYSEQLTITHRIIKLDQIEGGYKIYLQGDNRAEGSTTGGLVQTIDTTEIGSYNYVIGKVTGVSRALGGVMKISHSKLGIVLAIILPCCAIIIYESIKLILFFDKEKKAKVANAQQEKEDEIAELKKRLSELESKEEEK